MAIALDVVVSSRPPDVLKSQLVVATLTSSSPAGPGGGFRWTLLLVVAPQMTTPHIIVVNVVPRGLRLGWFVSHCSIHVAIAPQMQGSMAADICY